MINERIKQIESMKMSEKIKEIYVMMESLCGDFQKSDLHNDILERDYPKFFQSLDDTSAEVFSWFESVQEQEKNIPFIKERKPLEIVHCEEFCKFAYDSNARIFVKNAAPYINEYIFKYQIDGNGQTFYHGVELSTDIPLEKVIKGVMDYTWEDISWCWIEESEFIEWMTK